MSIKEEVLSIVQEYVEIPIDEIDTADGLKFASGLDSFGVLSMISEIEERFNIKVPDTKLMELKTLDDIIKFVEQTKQ